MPFSIPSEQKEFQFHVNGDGLPLAKVITLAETFSVYRIVCFATGEVYVGCSRDPKIRRISHFRDLRRGEHYNRNLQRAYDQWGESLFYFEVIERDIPASEAFNRERYWIACFDSINRGYNVMDASGSADIRPGEACVWNGVEYPSIAAAARANNLDPSSMWHRIHNEQSHDEEVGIDPRSITCVWNGIEYRSIESAARALGMPASTMRKYLREGKTGDKDIQSTRRPCSWNGIVYPSVGEAARSIGMPKSTLRLYLSKGYIGDADRFVSVKSERAA